MTSQEQLNRRFSVAPMMDWSDRHCRYLWRLLSKHALLYTEMVTTGALLYGDTRRFLNFNTAEHPVALQLGGCSPEALAKCAVLGEKWGYSEVNLNCGCPSDRVQEGKIGAILMAEPQLVKDCIAAMREATSLPITVKHRIGIDNMDDYNGMLAFIDTVAEADCDTFIVHARKAWLKGLSPKENREIPPLLHENVYRLKLERPNLNIIINGGIKTLEQSAEMLRHVDGVMMGREAYHNPYCLAELDQKLYEEDSPVISREEVVRQYAIYCQKEVESGTRLHHMSRHILGLYSAQRGGRLFRRYITENASKPGANHLVLLNALKYVETG